MSKYEYVGYTLMACALCVVCWSNGSPWPLNLGLMWAGVLAGVVLSELLNEGECDDV